MLKIKGDIMKKTGSILTVACISLIIGVCIAYYNTSSLGYDNANIISFNGESVKVLDMDIKYEDIKKEINKIKNSVPSEHIAI